MSNQKESEVVQLDTIPETAEALRVSNDSVRRLLAAGDLIGVKIRRRHLVVRKSRDKLIAQGGTQK